ncbi:MAG: glycosyltransferase [Clostridia bacterium]|nr:glycosyltransferase [Clostridia bacterium]
MKPAVLYYFSTFSTNGGTTSKIKATLEYTNCRIYIAAQCVGENKQLLKSWEGENITGIIELSKRRDILKNVIKLNKYIKENRIDIIHTFFPSETYVAAILKLLNPKLKLVRSFEGVENRKPIVKFFSKLSLKKFDKIIFISKYVKDFYDTFTKGISNREIIYNSAGNICEYKLQEKAENCNIVSVAGLNPSKNIKMYAEISKELKKRGFAFKMRIVGDGALRGELEALIKEYCIENELILLGYQNPKKYYEEAYIYIHPADLEGFGIVIPEAMSAGLPVIVSNKGALPELVNNMENGIIIDAYKAEEWANAIIKLYNNRNLYKVLSENGYMTYKTKFTREIFAKRLDEVYTELTYK